jgi:hypothetical protein
MAWLHHDDGDDRTVGIAVVPARRAIETAVLFNARHRRNRREQRDRVVETLRSLGWSNRRIAAVLDVSYGTVAQVPGDQNRSPGNPSTDGEPVPGVEMPEYAGRRSTGSPGEALRARLRRRRTAVTLVTAVVGSRLDGAGDERSESSVDRSARWRKFATWRSRRIGIDRDRPFRRVPRSFVIEEGAFRDTSGAVRSRDGRVRSRPA